MDQKAMEESEAKKKYLRRYLNAKRAQETIEREIDALRLEMLPGSPTQDGMPHGFGGGDLSEYVARLDELDRKLHRQLEQKLKVRIEITERIDEMQNETESLLLRLRYIHGLKWEEIAERMDYSWRGIHKIHAKALRDFEIPIEIPKECIEVHTPSVI